MISVVMTSETDGLVSIAEDDVAATLEAGEVTAGVLMMTVVDEAASVEELSAAEERMLEVDSVPDEEAEDTGMEAGVVSVAVTGQIVVETGITTVVRTVERAGQLVISGPQLMTVETDVEKIVDVVSSTGVVMGLDSTGVLVAGVVSGEELDGVDSTPWLDEEAGVERGVVSEGDDTGVVVAADEAGVVITLVGFVKVAVVDDWYTVLEAELQSNPTLWKPIEHVDFPPPLDWWG